MNLDQIKELLLTFHPKGRVRFVKKHPEIIQTLNIAYPNISVYLQVDSLVNGTSPYCIVCSSPIKTSGKTTCSTACRSIAIKPYTQEKSNKQKATIAKLKRDPNYQKEITSRRLATLQEKYGAKVSPKALQSAISRVDILLKKGKETLKERYGVVNAGMMPDHRAKCIETQLAHYGSLYLNSKEFKEASESNRLSVFSRLAPSTITISSIDVAPIELTAQFDNPNYRISFICSACNSTDTIPTETFKWRIRENGSSCRKCTNLTRGSLKEQQLAEYIQSLGLDVQRNVRILQGKEIDIFIPSLNLGFEFNGIFWHSSTDTPKNYHRTKSILASKLGIKLIHVYEDMWDFYPQLLKSLILKEVNLVPIIKEYGVKSISKSEATAFINANSFTCNEFTSHVALCSDTEIVAIMTLNDNELIQYCEIAKYKIQCGAQSLFTHFIKSCNYSVITSACQNDWPTDVLLTLGFTQLSSNFEVSKYVDLKQGRRQLFPITDRIIFDSGSTTWQWNRS